MVRHCDFKQCGEERLWLDKGWYEWDLLIGGNDEGGDGLEQFLVQDNWQTE